MGTDSSLTAEEASAIEYVKGIKDFYGHVFMYVFLVGIFGLVFGFRHPLIFWGAIGWGIGLLAHGLTVYEVVNVFGPRWEKKQIEKRLGRPL